MTSSMTEQYFLEAWHVGWNDGDEELFKARVVVVQKPNCTTVVLHITEAVVSRQLALDTAAAWCLSHDVENFEVE